MTLPFWSIRHFCPRSEHFHHRTGLFHHRSGHFLHRSGHFPIVQDISPIVQDISSIVQSISSIVQSSSTIVQSISTIVQDSFSAGVGPIYGLCRTSFGLRRAYFNLFQTKNARFAKFAHADYVEFNCRKRTGMQICATLGFVFSVEKHGLSWSEYRQRRPLPRSKEMF